MAKPHFYLKDKNSKQPTLIVLYYYVNGKRFAYSTGKEIHPSKWSRKKERVQSSSKFSDTINPVLERLVKQVQISEESIKANHGQVRSQDLKRALDIAEGKIKVGDSLFEFIELEIEKRSQSEKYSPNSIKVYNTMYKSLKSYAKETKWEYDFRDIDHSFFKGFTDYLAKQKHSNNYIHKIISTLRTFLNEATRTGSNKYSNYKDAKIPIKKEESDSIYLTESELKKMFNYDLSKIPRLERVRDLFIVGAYTGLRYSDFTRIKTHDHIRLVEGVKTIEIIPKKTENVNKIKVIIPLHPFVKIILEKYNGDLSKIAISSQRMNDYLKEIGKLVGFNDSVTKTITKGHKKESTIYKKHELLSTHTARRSFATNAVKSGADSLSVMLITGHKTSKSFMKYIKITEKENALRMAKTSFFNPPLSIAQ